MKIITIASIAILAMAICQSSLILADDDHHHSHPATVSASSGLHGVATTTASIAKSIAHPYLAYPVVHDSHGYHGHHYDSSHGHGHSYGHVSGHGYGHGHGHGHGYGHSHGHDFGVHGDVGVGLGHHAANAHGDLNVHLPHLHAPSFKYHLDKYGNKIKHKFHEYYGGYHPHHTQHHPAYSHLGHGHVSSHGHHHTGHYGSPHHVSHSVLTKTPSKVVQNTYNNVSVTKLDSPKRHNLRNMLGQMVPWTKSSDRHHKNDKIVINQGTNLGPVDV